MFGGDSEIRTRNTLTRLHGLNVATLPKFVHIPGVTKILVGCLGIEPSMPEATDLQSAAVTNAAHNPE